jgi:hypothetical protein
MVGIASPNSMSSKWTQYYITHKEQWDRNCLTIRNALERSDVKTPDVNGLYFEIMWSTTDGFMRSFVDFLIVHNGNKLYLHYFMPKMMSNHL